MSSATVGLLSIPYDANSSFCKGPAKAPAVIRDALLSGSLNKGTENGQLIQWGQNTNVLDDINISSPDDFVSDISSTVSSHLSKNLRLVSLGGDHSVTFPILKGYSEHFQELTIVHLDAHSDLYHEFKGNPYSNACPFARIMEAGLVKDLYQFGIRTLTEHQMAQARKFGVHVNEMKDWPTKLPYIKGPIYISIDIDAIDPAFAPGVSHREPGGLTSREVINLIHALPDNVVGIDIVEYNPDKDIDNITANLAAKLVKESIGKLLSSFSK